MADISLYESIAIKHLRAFAILLIISCHLLQGLGSSLAFVFNVGVQIFLVISGFLYGRKTICTRMWLRKRFVAVYIPYIIFLIIVFPIFFLFSPENVNSSKVVAHVLDIQEYLGGGEWSRSSMVYDSNCFMLSRNTYFTINEKVQW